MSAPVVSGQGTNPSSLRTRPGLTPFDSFCAQSSGFAARGASPASHSPRRGRTDGRLLTSLSIPDVFFVEPHTVFDWLETGEVAGGARCDHLWS